MHIALPEGVTGFPVLKGVHLTIAGGAGGPVSRSSAGAGSLTEVQVTSATGTAGGFQLQVDDSEQVALQQAFLVAATRTPMMRVILVATINFIPHVLMDGVITNQEITSGDKPGESTLTITGEDLTKVMDLQAFDGFAVPRHAGQPARHGYSGEVCGLRRDPVGRPADRL